jgi:ankyrin repeat protein
MIAAGEGHEATVAALLSKQASVDTTDNSGALQYHHIRCGHHQRNVTTTR